MTKSLVWLRKVLNGIIIVNLALVTSRRPTWGHYCNIEMKFKEAVNLSYLWLLHKVPHSHVNYIRNEIQHWHILCFKVPRFQIQLSWIHGWRWNFQYSDMYFMLSTMLKWGFLVLVSPFIILVVNLQACFSLSSPKWRNRSYCWFQPGVEISADTYRIRHVSVFQGWTSQKGYRPIWPIFGPEYRLCIKFGI